MKKQKEVAQSAINRIPNKTSTLYSNDGMEIMTNTMQIAAPSSSNRPNPILV